MMAETAPMVSATIRFVSAPADAPSSLGAFEPKMVERT